MRDVTAATRICRQPIKPYVMIPVSVQGLEQPAVRPEVRVLDQA